MVRMITVFHVKENGPDLRSNLLRKLLCAPVFVGEKKDTYIYFLTAKYTFLFSVVLAVVFSFFYIIGMPLDVVGVWYPLVVSISCVCVFIPYFYLVFMKNVDIFNQNINWWNAFLNHARYRNRKTLLLVSVGGLMAFFLAFLFSGYAVLWMLLGSNLISSGYHVPLIIFSFLLIYLFTVFGGNGYAVVVPLLMIVWNSVQSVMDVLPTDAFRLFYVCFVLVVNGWWMSVLSMQSLVCLTWLRKLLCVK